MRGELKSAAGLKEVAVYDGTELLRRFLPNGAKEFAFTLDLTCDKQHNLVLVATDLDGGKAVSGEQWQRNHRLEECHCADRNNQLSYGYTITKDGFGLGIPDSQCLATPYKRIDCKGLAPSGIFKGDLRLGVGAFDGGAGGEPCFTAPMILNTDKGEVFSPAVSESFRLLHTGDVAMGEGLWEYNFTDNIQVANVWHTLWKTEPAKDFTVTKRNIFFNVDPDSPLAVFLWTMKTTMKRDLPNNGMTVGFIQMCETKFWAVRGSDQSFLSGLYKPDDSATPRWHKMPFGRGAYAAALASPLGGMAVFPMTDGLELNMGLPGNSRIFINQPAEQTPQKQGETKDVALLLLGIPRATDFTKQLPSPTNEVVERFRRDFGLDGGKTGYALDVKEGTLVGQRYTLDVDGQKSGCFSGALQGDLVSSLPVRVAGLNDRWSALLYDRTLKKARPLGVFEGQAWAMVKLHGRLDLFVGQPMLCDRPELFIQVTQTGTDEWDVEVHNPTDASIRTTLRKAPAFDPFRDKALKSPEVEIPAGSSIHLRGDGNSLELKQL